MSSKFMRAKAGHVFDPVFARVFNQLVPIKTSRRSSQVDQETIFLNHRWTLFNRAEQKPFGPFLKFQACAGAKSQTFAYSFGKDNTSELVNFYIHAIYFGLGHFLMAIFRYKGSATLLLRLTGALFGGIAVMAWAGRNAEPSKTRDALVLGFAVSNGLAAGVALLGALSGVYNQFAWGQLSPSLCLPAAFCGWGEAVCRARRERGERKVS